MMNMPQVWQCCVHMISRCWRVTLAGTSPSELLQGMLLGMIGKPCKQWVNINVKEALAEAGLEPHFPVEVSSVNAVLVRTHACFVAGLACDERRAQDCHQD